MRAEKIGVGWSACALSLCILLGASSVQAESFRVIVNSSNPAKSMRSEDISKLFLRKRTEWDHGGKVYPVDMTASKRVRASFSTAIHGKSVSAIKSYWQQAIFSGRGTPPPEQRSDGEVLAYVQSNEGAIGYVSAAANLSGVKAIEVRP